MLLQSIIKADLSPKAEVLVVGMDADTLLRGRFPLAHFWPPEGINRALDIPEKVEVVCISSRIEPGEIRRIETLVKERGITAIMREASLVTLREHLSSIFTSRPNGNGNGNGEKLVPHPPPPDPPAESVPARQRNFERRGVTNKFVRENANFSAPVASAEAKRLVAMGAVKNIQLTVSGVYQELLKQKRQMAGAPEKPAHLPPAPVHLSTKQLAQRVETVMADLKRQHEQRMSVLSGLLADMRSVETENIRLTETNHNLGRELKKLKEEIEPLREDRRTLREMQNLMAKRPPHP